MTSIDHLRERDGEGGGGEREREREGGGEEKERERGGGKGG